MVGRGRRNSVGLGAVLASESGAAPIQPSLPSPCPHLPHPFSGWESRGCQGRLCTESPGRLRAGCSRRVATRLGTSPRLAWPTFPRPHPTPPFPLSPYLLLLQLPQDVNSLKLLIKNILLSSPKVCFPVIFLLEGEMGGKGTVGQEWRSGLPKSP